MPDTSAPENLPLEESSTPPSLTIPFAVAAGLFMEGLDSTIIATSLPQMAHSLDVSPVHLSLAITSYILSLAIFTPISGWMADRFGARRVFCGAIITFTISSALCAMAQDLQSLVAARMLQGLGGSMLMPVARLILVRVFPKNELLRALNYMSMPALIGPMLGPVIGGFITEYFHWRWIFLINLPIGVIGLILVTRLIKELPIQRPPPFDLPGFLIVGVAFAFGQFWLECLGRGVISPLAQWALFIGSGVAFFLYVRYARNQVNPVLDLKLFKIATFRISIWWGSLSRIGIGGTPFLLPLLLQVGFGLDPLHAGIMVFVSISGAFFMRLGFSRVLRKLGLRKALIMNAAFLAALLVGFLFISPATPHWFLYIYFFVIGFFRSVQFISLNMSSFGDLPTESMSKGNTIFTISHRLSMGIGITVAAVALAGFGIHVQGPPPHFHLAFVTLAVIEAASIFGLWRLHPSAGREITG